MPEEMEKQRTAFFIIRGQDVRINEFLIDKQKENEELDYNEMQILRERDRERLRKMTYYCFTNECLTGLYPALFWRIRQ